MISFAEAKCPTNPVTHVVGGGVLTTGVDNYDIDTYPTDGSNSGAVGTVAWGADVQNPGAGLEAFRVYAICSTAGSIDVTGFFG